MKKVISTESALLDGFQGPPPPPGGAEENGGYGA